ncbi:MAG: hypothetical protein NZ740_04330 [Kiritimatiellae bacterium]|nr:hypothetical protein [Kiritimatiellia bacterium]MDW8458317.1 hypothetical protein [Verrucomicrobiota bacterium]
MNTTPEHLHLALNHLPFLGALFAIFPLIIGLLTRSRPTIVSGLAIAAFAGWTTPFVMATGEAAYERYERGAVAGWLDPGAGEFLEIHEQRAHRWSKILYASAGISTLGLILALRREKWVVLAAVVSLLFCAASTMAGVWIAESGGKIRRPDFRAEPLINAEPQVEFEEE